MNDPIALRPAVDADVDFLRRVYAVTREDVALFPWDEVQKSAFLRMQFDAQDRHYRGQFPGASFDLVLRDGLPVGRLTVDRGVDEVRVVDVAILPEHRGLGIGRSLLDGLIAEAARSGRPVRLQVAKTNRARSLYARLGFETIGGDDVYESMERRPG